MPRELIFGASPATRNLRKGVPMEWQSAATARSFPAPGSLPSFATPSTYVWAVASDPAGNAYLATGSPATVLKVTPDGKSTKLFETTDLTVQAVRVGPDGSVYAATLPSGKVYKLKPDATGLDEKTATVAFDPAATAEKPKYIWDLLFDAKGRLYIATGGPAAIYRVDVSQPGAKPELFFKSDEQHIRCMAFDHQGNLIAGSDGSRIGLPHRPGRQGLHRLRRAQARDHRRRGRRRWHYLRKRRRRTKSQQPASVAGHWNSRHHRDHYHPAAWIGASLECQQHRAGRLRHL